MLSYKLREKGICTAVYCINLYVIANEYRDISEWSDMMSTETGWNPKTGSLYYFGGLYKDEMLLFLPLSRLFIFVGCFPFQHICIKAKPEAYENSQGCIGSNLITLENIQNFCIYSKLFLLHQLRIPLSYFDIYKSFSWTIYHFVATIGRRF
jgi:hypothetical protein